MAETENITAVDTGFAVPGNAEVVSPQEFSDEEFDDYIDGVKNGTEVPTREEANPQAEEEEEKQEEEKHEPYRSFETEEEFRGFVQKVISDRFRNSKEAEYEDLGRKAQVIFGGESPKEGLNNMLTEFGKQKAEEIGIEPEEYERDMRDRADAEAYRRQIAEAAEREKAVASIQNEWIKDSENLKKAVPDFDFAKAMENDKFRELVLGGASVSAAYITLMHTSPQEGAAKKVIREVGASSPGVRESEKQAPMSMTDAEFDRYIKSIRG